MERKKNVLYMVHIDILTTKILYSTLISVQILIRPDGYPSVDIGTS